MHILPRTIYFATVDFGRDGIGFGGDFSETAGDALDRAMGSVFEPVDLRIFRVDFDPDNNLPECIRDVTEDTIRERNEWLAAQGRRQIEVAA